MSCIRHLRVIVSTTRQKLKRYPVIHRPLRQVVRIALRVPGALRLLARIKDAAFLDKVDYKQWIINNDTLTDGDRHAIDCHINRMSYRPLISIVMPVFNTQPALLLQALGSVRTQLYPAWELCIADDASSNPETLRALASTAAADARIKVVHRTTDGHISAASNSALSLATGDFVALMGHADVLPEQALYEIAAEINAHPGVDLIYTDEDKINGDGERFQPYFKPDWNPELLLAQNFINHLGVYRRTLLDSIGGFRLGFEGSQDYDLALRASEHTTSERIRHIPTVLYHWRQRSDAASFSETAFAHCGDANRRAVAEHLARIGTTGAEVSALPQMPSWVQVRRSLPASCPRVSVIIPTRDRAELLRVCLDGLLHNTDYPALEVLIVDNDSREASALALLEELQRDPRVRVLRVGGPFNYSDLNNQAAAQANGEVLLLLNNDVTVISPGWLKAMVAQAIRPEVGAVGARLLYANGLVQHAGVVLGAGVAPGGGRGFAAHLHLGAARADHGYMGNLRLARNVSAVTGACLALRRSIFEEVGGLDAERLKVAFNDVDLCLKIRAKGYQVIWTPLAELYHLESASRGPDTRPQMMTRFQEEISVMLDRWGATLDSDPFYNPNFSLMGGHFHLALSTRRRRPWQTIVDASGKEVHQGAITPHRSGQSISHPGPV